MKYKKCQHGIPGFSLYGVIDGLVIGDILNIYDLEVFVSLKDVDSWLLHVSLL